ncbi:lactate utilization protein [Caldisalinibacter kiritimatiensis]|uniref:Transcriptional regulators of sugar metabolism n=1 Tax=Caldisalinibacter kiritimatiensis TaxID=1304284 RepID=R1ATK6_9FIRM|nr:lactate utilization protein [Caldisalinibacter kiritimatiensis]EOD00448.1 Transcriptional regulators of sugar metabolism [Caldisalinibacter kiritimatiensis]
MDKNVAYVIEKKVQRTIQNLEKNNMKGYFVQNEEEAIKKIEELLNEGNTVSVGGSMTLFEIGAIDFLRNGNYNFLDRYAEGLTKEDIKELYRKCFSADAYLTSSNAITENGELYNVDGRGNRVAAMIYGPDKVIVVAGVNKIVKDLDEAIERNKRIAAPANVQRLNRNTPCAKTGYCMDCNSPDRICNEYVLIKGQMEKDRIHVIIVNKELGY